LGRNKPFALHHAFSNGLLILKIFAMEDTTQKKNLSRRNFLETGITGAAGVALGLAVGNTLLTSREEAPEMVKMLTADGQLVQVEKRLLPEPCGKPLAVSNQELLAWMEKGKTQPVK
jgi:hypothetical protein